MSVCVVLAAGESRRSGPTPKALLRLSDGRTVLRTLLETAHEAGFDVPIVVVGAHATSLMQELEGAGAVAVENPDWESGRTGSAKCGLRRAGSGHGGCLLWPVDHPFVRASTLRSLLQPTNMRGRGSSGRGGKEKTESAEGRGEGGTPAPDWVLPTFQGHRGHPVWLSDRAALEVLRFPDDRPLFRYPRSHPDRVMEVPVEDPGVLENIDTPEAFAAARERFETEGGKAPTSLPHRS